MNQLIPTVLTWLAPIWAWLSTHFGWVGINIVAPIVLPMMGLWLVKGTMPITPAQKDKSRIITTVQDGQLGWLAVAWSSAAVYEAVEYMHKLNRFVDWIGVLLAVEFVLVLTGMFVAAGGAITASDAPRKDHKYLISSTIITLASAIVFMYVHAATE